MAIRCAIKAIIIKNGAILLNRCKGEDGDIYYDLPGGGQKRDIPTEPDFGMEESVWMPLEKLDDNVKTRPGCLKEILHRIAKADVHVPMYLGTEYIDRY